MADKTGAASEWSIARRVEVPASAAVLPMPTLAQQKAKVPAGHPRLFLRPDDVPRLRELARTTSAKDFAALKKAADAAIKAGPTAEPEHLGSARDKNNAELIKYWWPNRVQTEKACEEAETIAFVYLLTGDKNYGEAARRWVLHLASWDPKGTTNFTLNCEAGKPLLYRPARAYDWAWDMFTAEERAKIQTTFRARVIEAWNSGEVQKGVGHGFTQAHGVAGGPVAAELDGVSRPEQHHSGAEQEAPHFVTALETHRRVVVVPGAHVAGARWVHH
eukprot:gene13395-17795_t